MKNHIAMIAISAACCTGPVFADQELATAKLCMACHQVEVKIVGPTYNDVAAKYKGNTDAATLAGKIKAGGVGVWGEIPMPPQPTLSDAEATKLAEWILSM